MSSDLVSLMERRSEAMLNECCNEETTEESKLKKKPKLVYTRSLGGKMGTVSLPDLDTFYEELEQEKFWEKFYN